MNLIETCTNTLVSGIRKGAVYRDYRKALKALEDMPEVKKKVDELRLLNYQMQQDNDIDLYRAMNEIDNRFDELRTIPEACEFLEAELSLCRQLQDINATIHQGINIDVPLDL